VKDKTKYVCPSECQERHVGGGGIAAVLIS